MPYRCIRSRGAWRCSLSAHAASPAYIRYPAPPAAPIFRNVPPTLSRSGSAASEFAHRTTGCGAYCSQTYALLSEIQAMLPITRPRLVPRAPSPNRSARHATNYHHSNRTGSKAGSIGVRRTAACRTCSTSSACTIVRNVSRKWNAGIIFGH